MYPVTTLPRELSLPPTNLLSSRPSFRMRASMTPQPNLFASSNIRRDASEPPPITSLMSNPIFVRGPSQASLHRQSTPSITLGSFVDSQRSVGHHYNSFTISLHLSFNPTVSLSRSPTQFASFWISGSAYRCFHDFTTKPGRKGTS